jgi:hypothetical protein
VNRIGDAGLILGMILAYHAFGSLDLVEIADNAGSLAPEALGQFGAVTVVCLLLFVGACGKSAQIPLHVWLPDAMEGPTPVSALIHAATMVTAGVYMVARLAPLYTRSATALMVVATIGAATALMAATIALVQTDIKRVLAYSTVSQLGYMFLACGVGAFGVAVFHLFTHAFFKALLFLGSGSVIHALSGEQDMRRMGGLRKLIPWTFATFVVGTLAIAGIPPLAGFFSKDEILASALGKYGNVFFAIGLLTALLTAFYMARLLFLTFFGATAGRSTTSTSRRPRCWSPSWSWPRGRRWADSWASALRGARLPPGRARGGPPRLASLGGEPDRDPGHRRRLLPLRDLHGGAGAAGRVAPRGVPRPRAQVRLRRSLQLDRAPRRGGREPHRALGGPGRLGDRQRRQRDGRLLPQPLPRGTDAADRPRPRLRAGDARGAVALVTYLLWAR